MACGEGALGWEGFLTTPFPGSPESPPVDAFHTPHPCVLKPGIQTVLNVCLWPPIQSHLAKRQWAQGMVCPARQGWGHRPKFQCGQVLQTCLGPSERWGTSDPFQVM